MNARLWTRRSLVIFLLGWAVFFTILWAQLFFQDTAGNVVTRHSYAWADWAAHFTMGSSFGYRSLWLAESPLIIGQKFSYPFLVNYISGLLIRAQVPFLWAFVIPSWLCSLAAIGLLYGWFAQWLKSRTQAALAGTVFLLNGGLGWWIWFQRMRTAIDPVQTLIAPSFDLTNLESEGIRWISVINSMIVPQRAFTLGLPLGLVILILFYQLLSRLLSPPKHPAKLTNWQLAGGVGILLGLLPLIHTHTFLALVIILSSWGLTALCLSTPKNRGRLWLYLIGAATLSIIVATPTLMTVFAGHVSESFVKWYPGWLAKEFEMNWMWFWIKNWGLTPILALVGILLAFKDRRFTSLQRWLWLPFVIIFVMSNLVLVQPWSWDNTKLLTWSSVGMSGYAVYTLAWLWHELKTKSWSHAVAKVGIGVVFGSLIVSGGVDALNAINPARDTYVMYTAEELELAKWVKTETPVTAVWLTTQRHNHWLFNLTGRQAVMTYPGWLWSQGYDFSPVERDVKNMWADPSRTLLYDQYRVQYVVIDLNNPAQFNAAGFTGHPDFILRRATPNYLIYERKIISNLDRAH